MNYINYIIGTVLLLVLMWFMYKSVDVSVKEEK